ncbi:MAG: serine hydrolase domain-containing protein [Reichenbachiella sp.]|uniref:serine hydrolase domain-containing protein n=1 Tax=Reichenbachiella sp. TaxID=2184521 RepID=UPI0029671BF9|nr:serine hydrolase domain-containing protein [Reichenbachiella sp.]MDW3209974.1 serine hydrolase domain-containing protein [Reichenbachiella sp.]
MKRTIRACVIVAISIVCGCTSPKETRHVDVKRPTTKLDQFVGQQIDEYQIGGAIAIGIVKDGEVIAEEVYGYADFKNKKKADVQTQFYIASMTKSFVGTLVKLMEETAVMDLSVAMNDILKIDFPEGTQVDDITMEDLLIHTAGLKNSAVGIKTAYSGDFTTEELLHDLEASTYQQGYGTYDYTNLGYILAGMVLEKLTQKSWKQLLEEDIFNPLDMQQTSAYLIPSERVEFSNRLALPHTISHDSIKTGSFMKRDDTMHAAGGLVTTVSDMNKWLLAHLDTSETAYFSRDLLDEIHSDRIDFYDKSAGINNYGYGLGWEQGDWHEYDISWHGGGYPGYVSVHALVREQNLGIVIMMSQQSRVIELILNYILADQLGVDNAKELTAMEESIRSRTDRYQHYKDSIFQTVDSEEIKKVSLEKFVGRYASDQLNQLVVKSKDHQLILQLGNLLFIGEYIGDDKFLIKSEVDDTFDTVDFYHLNSTDRDSYLEMFGQKFYKGQNN